MSGSLASAAFAERPSCVLELQTALPAALEFEFARPALVDRMLSRLGRASAAVVAGSEGSGKTTFAGQVVRAWPGETAFISLTSRDSAESLWALVTAATETASPVVASRDAAIAGVLGAANPLVVFDDVHQLDAPTQRELAGLITDLSGQARFVITMRGDDAGLVDRLRGHGKVFDFDAGELAFDDAELAALYDALASGSHDDRSAGWPALAHVGLAAPAGRVPRIDDYLQRVVLGSVPASTRAALRWASLFSRWTVELVKLVCESSEFSASDLRGRAPAVTEVAHDGVAWFSLHPRLQAVLSAELLANESPQRVLAARSASARWLAENGALRLADECGLSAAVAVQYPETLHDERLASTVRHQFLHRVKELAPSASSHDVADFDLTAREHEILGLLLTRSTLKEIGQQIHLSPHTIKTHTRNLYRKLGVATRREAAEFAERHVLVPEPNTPEG